MRKKQITAALLAGVLTCGCAGAAVNTARAQGGTDHADSPPWLEAQVRSMTSQVNGRGETAGVFKEETVYIITGANGAVEKIIVSDWLKNPEGHSAIRDASDLSDVEAVKGDAAYTVGGDQSLVWDTKGGDVYYQGTLSKELPVTVTARYFLDGAAIEPDDLAGRSGKVKIRFDYENTQYEMKDVNGTQEKIYVPFAMLTGMVLDGDRFTNVAVSNGKIMNDGDHVAVIGLAFPGLQENLDLDRDTLDLPDYVEITADVTDFELATAFTMATNEVFTDVEEDGLDDLDGLNDDLDELTDGMEQLLDGSSQLYDGLNTLMEGTGKLADGVSALSQGLDTLTSNSSSLTGGARQVFDSLLETANSQLAAAGLDFPALTVENYADVLESALGSLDENMVIASARAQVEQGVRAQADEVRAAVAGAVRQEVASQVEAAVRAQVEQQVLAAQGMTPETVPQEAVPKIQAAVDQQMNTAEVKGKVEAALEEQMQSAEITAMIDAKTEEQIQLLIDQNMESEEAQAQINAGMAQLGEGAVQLQNLKAQLDGYNTFYRGLITYTDGVSSAAAGAKELDSSMPEFVSGVKELRDGAMELSDGLKEFDEKGVQKLVDAVDGDLNGLTARLRATLDVSRNYQSFSGLADGTDGAVRFIFRSQAIEAPEE